MIVVTSFSKSGYEEYGRNCLESFVKYWPGKLVVYYESPPDFEHEKIEYRNFFEIGPVPAFYTYLKSIPGTNGLVDGGYDYNKNAWKFTRKIFAQWDVLKDHKGKVFWLDADVETTKPITEEWLESLFDGKALSYLGRSKFYTETGFLGFDTEHKDFPEFLDRYINCLRKGIFLTLERWHDCEIFDWARVNTSGNNLSPFFKVKREMTLEELDVFARSVLGEYMTHYKGRRKREISSGV
jgi:hypothetical protein